VKRVVATLAFAGLALVAAACGAAGPSTPPASVDPNAIQISANGLKFDKTELSAPADKPFQIAFDNKESAPHNVAIYRDEARTQKVIAEAPFSGPKVVTYSVPALAAGSYVFICDIHTDMKGTLTVG
jgi:plastocyanin